ncbi:MAG: DUF4352 domain-containing protein [Chloroflexi bacterium]|nr:DUF4352 domain-containing protein [Chloroflexota bacterium]
MKRFQTLLTRTFLFFCIILSVIIFQGCTSSSNPSLAAKRYKMFYDTGIRDLEKGRLEEAIGNFSDVPESSEYYQKAQNQIEYVNQRLDEKITIEYGTIYKCTKCGKVLKKFIKQKNCKRRERANFNINEERASLCPDCERSEKQAEFERKKLERQAAIDQMKRYEQGIGPEEVAVTRINISKWESGYTAGENCQFVAMGINVLNTGDSTTHANPNYFTLSTPDGYTVNPDTDTTYGLSRHFDAIDLSPNSYTYGWLIFHIPIKDYYILHYKTYDSSVDKKIIPQNI